MKNILFITNDGSRTGAPILLLNLINWFVEHKSDTYKITLLAVKGGPLINDFKKIIDVKILNHKSDTKFKLLNSVWSKINNRKAKFELKQTKWDLIFSNTIVNGKQIEFLKTASVPVISYIHELEYSISSYLKIGVVQGTLLHSDFFICGSHMVKNNLINNHKIESSKTSVVNSFADLKSNDKNFKISESIKKELSIPANAMVVGMMGKLNWRKGADFFAKTASRLASKNIVFLWVGASNQSLIEMLNYDLEKSNKDIKLKMVPPTPEFSKYFSVIDVFFLSSREDPYPMVFIEAASYGIPILCFENAGGAQEFIDDKVGAVIPYGDIEAAVDKIQYFYDHRELLDTNANYIKAKSITSHDVAVNAPHIVNVIEKLIEN
ncbi:glycosyltransferase [Psychroserpens damuponensis]|uniref:glycosyltransferase n=1 Tax=Psychroserpens damuponensis TaxID=943936 RepID=UPI00058F530A|nr:glycosyltransferase [Psychroserpens damuponensis]